MPKIQLKVKAVIFDMDGVITNTMSDHFKAWKKIFADEGINVTRLDVYSREGQKGIHSVREIFEVYKKPFGLSKAKDLLNKKEELFKKIAKKRFIPGARRFLRALHQKGFLLALVTGTSRHELHRILPDDLYNLFAVTVTGNDVKHGKPHPEPFIKAIKKLKVSSKEVFVIENSPLGIRSAGAAGLQCLALETSLPKKYLKDADKIFNSIQDLQKSVSISYL